MDDSIKFSGDLLKMENQTIYNTHQFSAIEDGLEYVKDSDMAYLTEKCAKCSLMASSHGTTQDDGDFNDDWAVDIIYDTDGNESFINCEEMQIKNLLE